MEWLKAPLVASSRVIDFTGGSEFWAQKDLKMIDEGAWIARNWQEEWQHAQENRARLSVCSALIKTGGPILEIAAGPGGGNLSPLAHLLPGIRIVVNDLESRLLHKWADFAESQNITGLSFLACDATELPLCDDSMAGVSSRGGISNCMGSHSQVLRECARVLRPGGLLGMYEMALTEECLLGMPPSLRDALVYNPFLFRGWNALLPKVGLKVISEHSAERSRLEPEESALARDALDFGYVLEIEMVALVARKE